MLTRASNIYLKQIGVIQLCIGVTLVVGGWIAMM